jgi:flagellar basal-body rod protein FlgB
MNLISSTVEAVERSLDGLALRHEAYATNIANLNTPGYVAEQVNFEQSLRDALAQSEKPLDAPFSPMGEASSFDGMALGEAPMATGITAGGSDVMLQTWQASMTKGLAGPQRIDNNHVSLATEISGMAGNALKYNAVSTFIAKEYQVLNTIVQAH